MTAHGVKDEDCLFCKIVAGDIDADVVHESATTLAFRDLNPQAPTHVLVIPKTHVPSLNEATDPEMLGRLMLVARTIAQAEGLAEDGYRAVVNTGASAGQTVFHIHLHLLGGRHLGWPPG
jgi:histidine triad (HIT) family protein